MKYFDRRSAIGVLALAGLGIAGGRAGAASSGLFQASHPGGGPPVESTAGPAISSSDVAPPTVPLHPSRVSIVWLPGLNDKIDNSVVTHGNSRIASELARDVNSAPFVPDAGGIMCPLDDGTNARLYFMYPHRRMRQINADLSGCSFITEPGYGSRSSTIRFRQDMTTLAPKAWRAYIASNPDPTG
jgi:hypothetical protein